MKKRKRELIHQDIQDKVQKKTKRDTIPNRSTQQQQTQKHFEEVEQRAQAGEVLKLEVLGSGSKKIPYYMDQIKQSLKAHQIEILLEARNTCINKMVSLVETAKRELGEHKYIKQENRILEKGQDQCMQVILTISAE